LVMWEYRLSSKMGVGVGYSDLYKGIIYGSSWGQQHRGKNSHMKYASGLPWQERGYPSAGSWGRALLWPPFLAKRRFHVLCFTPVSSTQYPLFRLPAQTTKETCWKKVSSTKECRTLGQATFLSWVMCPPVQLLWAASKPSLLNLGNNGNQRYLGNPSPPLVTPLSYI
jgi:hypothetical protein